jgi:hypothetical protein
VLPDDRVRDCTARHRNRDHAAACCLNGLADRFGNFVRLAGGETDASLAIAYCDERVEREATTTLHHLRYSVDRDNVLDEIAALALPTATTVTSTAWTTTAAWTTSALAAALATTILAATLSAATATGATATTCTAAPTLLAAAGTRAATGAAAVGRTAA